MILKIDIDNFGIYKEFRWNCINGLNNTTFKKLNIIYGRNYSGKTTLSRIFRSLEEKKYPYFIKNPKFTIYFGNEKRNQDTIFDKELNIIVYNDDFVKDNLGFFYDENKNIKSFKVRVGKDNKKILEKIKEEQKRLDKAGKIYDKIEQKRNDKFRIYKEKENELIKLLQNKANRDIKHNKLYGMANYNIKYIEKDIEFIKQNDSNLEFLLDEETENKKNKILKEEKKEKITFNNEFDFDSFDKLLEEIKKVLLLEIKPSKIIEELLNNYELEQWVKKGIELHRNKRNRCAFCGNKIDNIRYEELDRHFDKVNEEFENKINQLKKDIKNVDTIFNLEEESFYESFKNDFKVYKTQFKEINKKFQKFKDKLTNILDDKLKNKSKSLKLDDNITNEFENLKREIEVFYKNLKELVNKNNEFTDNLIEIQEEAKEQLRLNDVKKFLRDINYFNQIKRIEELKQKVEIWENRFNKIKDYKQDLKDKIEKLKDRLNDERASIELINEFLELTSSHLKLDIDDKTNKQISYEILRENEKAKRLSNGEQSLIAFCYFLAKVKNKLDNEKNIIIYIDDPVSSLDNNHIFSIFALLEKYITKNKEYYQYFISTHNLDFLRYLKRITIPRIKDDNGKEKEDIEYFLIERLKKGIISNSQIKLLPKHLKDYTTELHYIFEKIYKLYTKNQNKNIKTIKGEINNTYNDFYEIPNLLRKFLEYYLFYKYPDNDGLTIKKLSFFGKNGEAEKINRIVNEYSHLTYIERAWKPLDVEEIIEIISNIIETIKDKDEEYFKHLLKATK